MSMLWQRQLDTYPSTGKRMWYLAIVVLATILLYYEFYTQGAVAPEILRQYGMSFHFYVYITVIANALGAFASVIAGLADRWGRANLVAYGLLITGLLVLFGIPNAPNEWSYGIILSAIGFVEGIILVATPALVRDFSPQLGRASAMGFWTLGPVIASLIVSEVASHTLPHLHAWQDQFTICGLAGIGVFLLALFGLRELAPSLRDQLMVSVRDRALVEAKAAGLDVESMLEKPWRQMLRPDVILGALAISTFLIIYYTAVGFNVVYFQTVFNFTTAKANSVGNWWWAFNALALVIVGVLSDKVRVRKPFMVFGCVGAIVMSIIYLGYATHPHTTSYSTLVLTVTVLAAFMAFAYAPWMAAFTETVERRNPALIATGLAVWGWIIRAVVAISILILPIVITSVTPLVEHGALGQKAEAIEKADPLIKTVIAHPALFTQLAKYPTTGIPPALLDKAIKEIGLPKLLAISKDTKIKSEAAFFTKNAATLTSVQKAAAATPHQWQRWFWVCIGGEALFLPLMLFLKGRWRPKSARRDDEEHEKRVAEELAALNAGS
ncbi:MAG: MFS transporter [Acidimicrobiales bacterium]|jgi:MFS family permease